METFNTDDGLVLKYQHDDDSETAIKAISSCDTIINPVTGVVEYNNVERNKYSVFVSVSAGCFMKCDFCYLTIKDMKYGKLSGEGILNNLKEALEHQIKINPSLKDRYIKICWMGMGDALVAPEIVHDVTLEFLDWVGEKGYAKGLDGVDMSSVIPNNVGIGWIDIFQELNNELKNFPLNPNNDVVVHKEKLSSNMDHYTKRSPFRFFYSLHSVVQSTRDKIIPNGLPVKDANLYLNLFSPFNEPNIIFHHMFMEGVNDSDEEVDALIEFLLKTGISENRELRILRYNDCEDTTINESPRFDELVGKLAKYQKRLKVQISTGKEISAACGQFITNTE